MDYKREAAVAALSLIQPGSTVGFGAGSTVAYLINLVSEDASLVGSLRVLSSSFATRELLRQNGFVVQEAGWTAQLDAYFDGCDQFDRRLSALKSGGGVHTSEKALAYVSDRVERFFQPFRSVVRRSNKKDGAVITERGNFLIDCWFDPFPEPAVINDRLLGIPGILEHSLFYNLAHRAITAGPDGIKQYLRSGEL